MNLYSTHTVPNVLTSTEIDDLIEGSLALLNALSVALDHPFDAMSHNSAPLLLNVVIHNLNIVFSYYDELV